MSQLPQNRLPETPLSAIAPMEIAALQRRRALLSGLGKGAAATAALAPLISQARGTHKIANSALPGNFGYCSVSGFQSAAISGSPAPTVCSAFAPSHFLAIHSLIYTGTDNNLGLGNSVNANKLRDALNTKYVVSVFTSTNVAPLLSSLSPANPVVAVAGSGVVLIWTSSNTSTALTRNNWPTAALTGLEAFNSTFGGSDGRPLLRVLYDGVLSANPANANCYFLAAYLTVYNSTPGTLPTGLNKPYVIVQYINNANSSTNVYKFFHALCVTP